MKKLLNIILFLCAASNSSLGAVPMGTIDNPLELQIQPLPLIVDKTGKTVVFPYEDGKKAIDPYAPVIAFDVVALTSPISPEGVEKQSLPFSESKSMEFLKGFHASAESDNGTKLSETQLNLKVIYSQYSQKSMCGRIVVQPQGGWSSGNWTVNASFDVNQVKRDMGCVVGVTPESQAIQVRFESRAREGAEADRLEKRFAVQRDFEGSICRPPHLHSPTEDINALLKQFPDDMWGHAYSGYLSFNGISGDDLPYFRIRMVRQAGNTILDPTMQSRLDNTLFHYKFVLERLALGFAPKQPGTFEPPRPTPGFPAYRALGFDSWRGINGPLELRNYFSREVLFIKSLQEGLKSGALLSDDDIKDAQTVTEMMREGTLPSQALLASLKNRLVADDEILLRSQKPLSTAERNVVTFALNSLILGPPLDGIVPLQTVALSAESKQLIAEKPISPTTQSAYQVWSCRLNRRLLEDIFFPNIAKMPPIEVHR